MPVCSSCGRENDDDARFCQACGAPLGAVEPAREQRKVVSVVFTDVSGSTALGERLDPETMRRVQARYFDAVREVIERHGGTVEKFIGDAVMAVFGVPHVHEDDAVRAVRAAVDVRSSLDTLNVDLRYELGIEIITRTGVNTGAVVSGDVAGRERLVTGDAVNVAARLEQIAEPGEILVGAPTYQLVRDAVDVEPVPPLDLKGKSLPVAAYRLVSVRAGAEGRARRLDSPMVGRVRQLRLLADTFESATTDRACHLFTVLGSPGVGKSRLVREFLAAVRGRARVHVGRCLSYGDGITFWPVLEIIGDAAGLGEDDPPDVVRVKLGDLIGDVDDADDVRRRIEPLFGVSAATPALEETFWGIRRLLEAIALQRPLVVVVEDIHWAEPTLLELIEHVADWSRDAPILLLCMARPELLDVRPNWGGGKLNSTSILLEPLTAEESDALIANLLGDARLPDDVRERIRSGAEGNPLFVEEMLAMLIDDGLLVRDDGRWLTTGELAEVSVPPTIQALLAARLDRLALEERTVIERGAVEGTIFHVGGVITLAPEALRPRVRTSLMALVRKELIRPDRAEVAGEDAFRFRHMLLRDAAYDAMPKDTRADLHERFAAWLDGRSAEEERLAEVEAIVAYHLEQTARYRRELGTAGPHERDLEAGAGDRYRRAGSAAFARGDYSGSASLLERAAALLPDGGDRVRTIIDLGLAQTQVGDFVRAAHTFDRAIETASAADDAGAKAVAEALRSEVRTRVDPGWPGARHLEVVRASIATLEGRGEDASLARVYLTIPPFGSWRENAWAAERALEHATRTGDVALKRVALVFTVVPLAWGSEPVAACLARCERVLGDPSVTRADVAVLRSVRGLFLAMQGRFDEAHTEISAGRMILEEVGLRSQVAWSFAGGYVCEFQGDHAAAERMWREGFEQLSALGETNRASTLAAETARVVAVQGRDDDALHWARIAENAGADDDLDTLSVAGTARAIVALHRADAEKAAELARSAIEMIENRNTWQTAMIYEVLGDALEALGRREDATDAYRVALRHFDDKGVEPLADRARRRVAELSTDR